MALCVLLSSLTNFFAMSLFRSLHTHTHKHTQYSQSNCPVSLYTHTPQPTLTSRPSLEPGLPGSIIIKQSSINHWFRFLGRVRTYDVPQVSGLGCLQLLLDLRLHCSQRIRDREITQQKHRPFSGLPLGSFFSFSSSVCGL